MSKRSDLKDLTSGNLFVKLLAFSMPIFLSSILQVFFTTADLYTVGNFGGGNPSTAAIGSTNSLINLIVGLFLGLSLGTNVIVANAKGANNKEKAYRAIESSILIAVVSGVILAIIGLFFSRQFLIWMDTDPEALDGATLYVTIYLLGCPFLLLYNFSSSILRAFGDSKRPLISLIFAGIFNIGLNILLVVVFNLDILGVAIATVVSQAASAIASMYFLIRDKSLFCNYTFKGTKIYKEETIEIAKVGLASGAQSICFNISNVLIQKAINDLSLPVISGSTASSNFEGYLYWLLECIANGTLAMVAQNYGAKKKDNIRKCLLYALLMETFIVGLAGVLLFFIREDILKLLLKKDDEYYSEALKAACERSGIILITYFLCGYMDVLSSYLKGVKIAISPTIITVFGTVVTRLGFIFILFYNVPEFHNIQSLIWMYPISWAATSIFYAIFIPIRMRFFYKKNPDLISEKIARQQTN